MKTSEQFNFSADDKTIEDIIFSNLRYRIPRYQRPYAWGEDQMLDFWNDLYASASTYFIGSLVLNYETLDEDGYIEIIDGQQRLLTITIFMAILRNIAKEFDNEKLAGRIQRQCVSFEDKRGNETFRILCGESTKNFFEKYIQNFESDLDDIDGTKLTKEEKRIKDNYFLLKDKVLNEVNNFDKKSDQLAHLQNLWDKISKIKIIAIKIENEEDAYEIFETVNARGVDLTVGDLLKNLIFKEIKPSQDKDKDEIKNKWIEITDKVKETGVEMTKFIRYFWLSKYSFVSEKKLFKEIKRNISNYEIFLNDLIKNSHWFNMLLEGNLDEWQEIKNGDKIFKSLQGIRIMGMSQCYVLFLSILRNYDKLGTDPKRIFKLIENFSFKYSSICSLPGNKVEKIYSHYAREIEAVIKNNKNPKKISKQIQTIFNNIENELKELRPSYELFAENFGQLSYKNSEKSRKLTKYIFAKVNSQYETGEYIIDFGNVNIEHVLPQNPCKEWKLTKADIKNYVNKIGNLTLIHKTFNSKASNKPIKIKLKALGESKIPITQKLIEAIEKDDYKWGEEEINKRQHALGKKAYDIIWKY